MRFTNRSILQKLFIFLFLSLMILTPSEAQANEDIKIISQTQDLRFFLNEANKLNASLNVKLQVVSTASNAKFVWPVFYDSYTSVSNIAVKKKKRKIKFTPRKSDYESEGIFHSDLKVKWIDHIFENKDVPIHISYTKVFKDIKFVDPLYFSSYYPIEKSSITIDKPQWLKLGINEFNFSNRTVEQDEILNNGSTVYNYSQKDVKRDQPIPNAPGRNKIEPHIILVPKSVSKGEINTEYFKSTQQVYNWYASLVNSINNKPDELSKVVNEIIQNKNSDQQKIESIFYWVQDNIRYIAFEAGIMGFKPESCQKVFQNKYGDCKGMANLLKQMLILAGYDARLTWLGTKDLPYTYDLQSLLVDNHMICTVFLNGKPLFLDPTEKYIDMYNYAFRIQGKEALIEDKSNYIIKIIPESSYAENREKMILTLKFNEDKLVGKGLNTFNGNRKNDMYYNLGNTSKKDRKEQIENYISSYNKNVITSLINEPSLDNRSKELEFNFDVIIKNRVTDIGSEKYFNPDFDYILKSYKIEEDREVPFVFSNVYSMEYETSIQLEDEWAISYLPKEVDIRNPKFDFNLKYSHEGNVIKYLKKLNIKDAYLEVADFKTWNDAISSLKSFYEDQIIIKRK